MPRIDTEELLAYEPIKGTTAVALQQKTIRAICKEVDRLYAEVEALRAAQGMPTGTEPAGCPVPGCCAAEKLQETLLRWKGYLRTVLVATDITPSGKVTLGLVGSSMIQGIAGSIRKELNDAE